jgi:hypothetical protein
VHLGETEQEDMETAMNKDSTGMIKLAPKYANDTKSIANKPNLEIDADGYYIKKPKV